MPSFETTVAVLAVATLSAGCVVKGGVGADDGSGGEEAVTSAVASVGGGAPAGSGGADSGAGGTLSGSGGQGGAAPCAGCKVLAPAKTPSQLAVDTTHVYWDDGGMIRRVATSGGIFETLATKAWATSTEGLVVDANSIYMTSPLMPPDGSAGVEKVALGGGPITPVVVGADGSGPTYTTDLVVSPTRVAWGTYWTDVNDTWFGAVQTAPLGGGAPTTLYSGTAVFLLATDATDVYFAVRSLDTPETGSVLKVPFSGGAPTEVAAAVALSLAVDETDVYYCGAGIEKVSKSGGAPSTLAPDLFGPIAVDATDVYVGAYESGVSKIVKLPKSGGPSVVLATLALGERGLQEIAVDGTYVYGIYSGTVTDGNYNDDGAVIRVAKVPEGAE